MHMHYLTTATRTLKAAHQNEAVLIYQNCFVAFYLLQIWNSSLLMPSVCVFQDASSSESSLDHNLICTQATGILPDVKLNYAVGCELCQSLDIILAHEKAAIM